MVTTKNKVRTFEGMRYRKVQRKNSRNRNLLPKNRQKWLKENGYQNIGWNQVINLFKKLKEIQQEDNIKSLNLEELFIEAERIGNKYLDSKEIHKNNLALARELDKVADLFNEQFPDNTVEVIDYAKTVRRKS